MRIAGPIHVGFIDTEIAERYQELGRGSSVDKQVFRLIDRATDILKIRPFYGIQVKKEQIPGIYFTKYGIDNLWKYNLSEDWRMVYTVTGDGRNITVQIIEWFDHKEYDKRFGYS